MADCDDVDVGVIVVDPVSEIDLVILMVGGMDGVQGGVWF